MDHIDSIPKPRRVPLIVDLLVGTTRLTKAHMNGVAASTSCTSTPSMDLDIIGISSKVADTLSNEWSQESSPTPSGGSPY
jgi:hypothetical protein